MRFYADTQGAILRTRNLLTTLVVFQVAATTAFVVISTLIWKACGGPAFTLREFFLLGAVQATEVLIAL